MTNYYTLIINHTTNTRQKAHNDRFEVIQWSEYLLGYIR